MQIGAFAFIRLIVMFRRIWKSLNHLTEIEAARLDIEKRRFDADYPNYGKPKLKRMAEIGVVDVDELNKHWREKQLGHE